MGTNGIVSVTRGGDVIVKAVAGCNGYNHRKLANEIRKRKADTKEAVFAAAKAVGFGCPLCLVVIDSNGGIINPPDDEQALRRYHDTLCLPHFNPRWERGEASHTAVVELDFDGGRSIFDEEEEE